MNDDLDYCVVRVEREASNLSRTSGSNHLAYLVDSRKRRDKMSRAIVVLEWDEERLGPGWMNIDNLKLLLYTEHNTRHDLLRVADYKEEPNANPKSHNATEETDIES